MHASTSSLTSGQSLHSSRRSRSRSARTPSHSQTRTRTSATSTITTTLVVVLACISQTAAQMSVYVPGPIDEIPGNSPVAQGPAGVDGYTTYAIGGAILQENGASAIMTNYASNGVPIVYNCVIGADAQATCSVVQGDGVNYAYTEPITYFGQTTGQLPAAFASPTSSAGGAATTPTAVAGLGANGAAAGGAASSAPSSGATVASASATPNSKGPQKNQAQATGANAFGAGDVNGAALVEKKAMLGAAMMGAAVLGAAMVFA